VIKFYVALKEWFLLRFLNSFLPSDSNIGRIKSLTTAAASSAVISDLPATYPFSCFGYSFPFLESVFLDSKCCEFSVKAKSIFDFFFSISLDLPCILLPLADVRADLRIPI